MASDTILAANGIVSRSEDEPTVRVRLACEAADPEWRSKSSEPFEAAARSFHKLLHDWQSPDAAALEEWRHTFSGHPEHAQLFRDLYQQDPEAARRLVRAVHSMPEVGTHFGNFHLLGELGRGAFGRVFLAEQEDLARRHVVVKIAADVWGEANLLAQLQHPNIVPLYSVHYRDPFQIVCMPFRGSTTLQHVLDEIHSRHALPVSGRALLKTFTLQPPEPAESGPADSASRAQTLAQLSYGEAIVWLGTQLADALAHAHEHGIVHRDLKPANVLLTDDGQPLLLDFNVAEDTKLHDSATMAWMAGTFPYMAPEQLAALMGTATPVDGRCDIYAFGIMLHELLTGRYPFPARGPVRGMLEHLLEERRSLPIDLRRWNPAVSPALESIVRRCLQVDPERRYQSARELQEDLECQRTHQRLRHAPEPSWKECLLKWTRRNPRTTVAGVVGNCAVVLLTSLAVLLIARGRQMDRHRELEMERIKAQYAGDRAQSAWRLFQQDLKSAQFVLYTRTHEADQLDAGIALGYRLLAGYGIPDDPAWQDSALVRMLPPGDRAELAESTAELLLLVARAELLRHPHLGDPAARHAALTRALVLNERAEGCSKQAAASPALWRQRAELYALLGRSDECKFSRGRSEALPLRTAHDCYWLASDHVAAGRLREALPLLQQATQLDPQNFWAWFVLANGYDRLGQDRRAEGCYGSCIALAPGYAWSYFNRGLAFLRQQDYRLACADFDQSLRLRPDDPDAHLNRALARQGLRQYREADDDLTQALNLGGPGTRLFFLRSRVRDQLGDKGGAHHDYEEGLRTPPTDEKSWLARGFAHLSRDPDAALADFEEALRLNPRSAAGMTNKAHVLAEKLGRTEDALRVLDRAVELYPESAQARGGRGVLQARLGNRDAAHRDAEETLILEVTPARQYQVACIYALTARQQPDDRLQAMQLLSSALRAGYGLHLLETDADLNAIRDLPDFRRLVEAARTLRPAPPTAQAKNS